MIRDRAKRVHNRVVAPCLNAAGAGPGNRLREQKLLNQTAQQNTSPHIIMT